MTSTLTPVRKRSALTKGQLPKSAPYVVLAVALILGAAILALIGFNAFGWGIVSAILFAAGLVGWSAVVEGSRKAKDKLATCLVVGAFLVALLPLISVIWTVLVNGLPGLLDPGFLTTSMNGVTGAFDNKTRRGRRPRAGRHLPRAHGHRADHAARHRHLRPGGPADRDLPRGVRRGPPAGPRHHLLRGRHDRHPLDRGRPVRRRLLLRGGRARAPRPVPSPPSHCPC